MTRIIYAEDSYELRESIARLIRRLCSNAEVTVVENGKELVDKVKSEKYDLIITDNEMPIMNGIAAIKSIREFNKDATIYMLSGSDKEKEAKEAGATDFLSKGGNGLQKLKEILSKY